MTWTQSYTPLGGLALSALVAAIPVVVLMGLLAFSHVKAHVAALLGLAASLSVAIFVYGMPVKFAALAALDGAAYGLFPIGWIVLCAIFVYDITVSTGQFEIVKHSIAGLSDDRRIQAILIAFCFGSFLEGAAGFGTPVAICAAMLIGLGFKPLHAAGLALIGNTAPVAFGGLGIPIAALSRVTEISPEALSKMIGLQLAPFGLMIPFWLVWAMAGWRAMVEVWPACLAAGLSFGAVQLAVSNLHGPQLVDIAASLASILSMLVLLRFWKPKTIWRFDHEDPETAAAASIRPTRRQVVVAWMPWVIVSLLIFAWGVPTVKTFLDAHSFPDRSKALSEKDPAKAVSEQLNFEIPGLHKSVLRSPPVVAAVKPEEAVFKRNFLSAVGTSLLFAAILSGMVLGLSPMTLLRTFAKTLHRVRLSLLTIAAMLALGFTTKFAGLDVTLGLAFASTGVMFPFFSPLLGWLGVALTGSDTSSNVLFGGLQKTTAERLGVNPVLAAAANSSGGVMGKMIDAQSIVVASVATGQRGGEGQILRYVFFHSIALAVLVGLLVLLQAYVFK